MRPGILQTQSSSSALPDLAAHAFALQFVEWLLQLMELDRVDKLDVALIQHLVKLVVAVNVVHDFFQVINLLNVHLLTPYPFPFLLPVC